MSPSDELSKEKYLDLPGGRTLAYSENGNTSSSTLFLFFHGVFGVGNASRLNRVLVEKDLHYVAPTLPGWGNSSPIPSGTSFAAGLIADITALVEHLHPNDTNLRLYVSGGSYGTAPAQMLYGAPFDVFPLGRRIQGCLLLAPFSPFRWHKDYAKAMGLQNYVAVGPPSQMIPFRLLQRLTVFVMSGKVKTVEKAEIFIRNTLFDNMGEEELAAYKKWREREGMAEGKLERNMAENVVKSVQKNWDGFMEVSDVLHGDWGYRPDTLDDEHIKRPVFLVSSTEDSLAHDGMPQWLVENYKNSRLKAVAGGHLAALFHFDEIYTEFFEHEG